MRVTKQKFLLHQLLDSISLNGDRTKIFKDYIKENFNEVYYGLKQFSASYEQKSAVDYILPFVENVCHSINIVPWAASLLIIAAFNVLWSLTQSVFFSLVSLGLIALHIVPIALYTLTKVASAFWVMIGKFLESLSSFYGIYKFVENTCIFAADYLTGNDRTSREQLTESTKTIMKITYLAFPLVFLYHLYNEAGADTKWMSANIFDSQKTAAEGLLSSLKNSFFNCMFMLQVVLGAVVDEAWHLLKISSPILTLLRNEVFQRCNGLNSKSKFTVVVDMETSTELLQKVTDALKGAGGFKVINIADNKDDPKFARWTIWSKQNYAVCVNESDVVVYCTKSGDTKNRKIKILLSNESTDENDSYSGRATLHDSSNIALYHTSKENKHVCESLLTAMGYRTNLVESPVMRSLVDAESQSPGVLGNLRHI